MLGRRRDVLVAVCMALMLSWSVTSATAAHTYYVSGDGNDAADGRTKKGAWRTLARVARHTFATGDRLLLKEACTTTAPSSLAPTAQRATSRSARTVRAAPSSMLATARAS